MNFSDWGLGGSFRKSWLLGFFIGAGLFSEQAEARPEFSLCHAPRSRREQSFSPPFGEALLTIPK